MGEIDEKIVLYQRGLHICLQSPRAHFELANAYADRGETREALDELREVLRYDLNYPGARERLHALQEHSSLAGYENDASTNNASGRNGSSSTRKKQTK
jgi:tetratricopeptide (TPR) repeat protein